MNKSIASMIVTAVAIATSASCASPHFGDAGENRTLEGVAAQLAFNGSFPLVGDFYVGSNDWGMTNRL
jgi:hypothetical protein